MYIHLNPQRTQVFTGLHSTSRGLTLRWADWPIESESVSLVVWSTIASYKTDVAEMVKAFGPVAEGLPHELTSIYP